MADPAKLRLQGKVAVVTGAGRGIGRAEARILACEGAKVVVNDLGGGSAGGGGDASVAQAVVDEIRAGGGEAVAETSSVASMEGGRAVIQMALDAFGRIDILINNAGVARPVRVDETEEEDWDIVHAVNLKGPFATIRAAAPHFLAQRSGVIVNTSSPSGFGQYSNFPYCAAKEGVVGLTRAVARDLGPHGVRCNAIRPVASESQMGTERMYEVVKYSEEVLGIPAIWNRWSFTRRPPSTQESVASAAVWLCTDACSKLNGRELFIAGAEIGILPEPELIRAMGDAEGWDLDKLDDPKTRAYLIGDARNRFTGQGL